MKKYWIVLIMLMPLSVFADGITFSSGARGLEGKIRQIIADLEKLPGARGIGTVNVRFIVDNKLSAPKARKQAGTPHIAAPASFYSTGKVNVKYRLVGASSKTQPYTLHRIIAHELWHVWKNRYSRSDEQAAVDFVNGLKRPDLFGPDRGSYW